MNHIGCDIPWRDHDRVHAAARPLVRQGFVKEPMPPLLAEYAEIMMPP